MKKDAKTYTKKDVVRRASKILDCNMKDIKEEVDGFFKALTDILTEDRRRLRIEVRNFGVFEIKPTKAKPKARNPRTNEEVYVPPRRKTHFKPGKIIREELKRPLKEVGEGEVAEEFAD